MSNWGNKEEAENYKPKTGGGFWGKLEEGDNKLRLVSDYKYIGYHWQGMGVQSVVCLNRKPGDDLCPLCREKKTINGKQYPNTPNAKFVVNCIDLSDKDNLAIRHYEFPYAVIDAINGYALDPDYKFEDLPEWDMIVNKETKGEKKVDYKVRVARQNRPLSKEELELIEGFETPDDVVAFKLGKTEEDEKITEQQDKEADQSVATASNEEEIDIDEIPF